MQVDTESLGVVTAVVTSAIGSAINYGIMKAKVTRLEQDVKEGERKYVSNEIFRATIQPLKEDLHEMKQDLKDILKTIQKNLFEEKSKNQ